MAKILFIDDDVEIRSVIAQWLELYGHTVDVAASAAEAFEHLERKDYQLAICSLMLEDSVYPTGLELALTLREKQPVSKPMPVILAVPEDLGSSAWMLLRRHGIDFISKYLSLEAWAKKTQALLESADPTGGGDVWDANRTNNERRTRENP